MSTADHPQTYCQTERMNRDIGDKLLIVCANTPKRWSSMIPAVEFAFTNAVHASTGCTPLYVNDLTHPCVSLTLPLRGSSLSWGEVADRLADISHATVHKPVSGFLAAQLIVLRHLRNELAETQDKQKEQLDAKGRGFIEHYEVGDQALLKYKTYLRMQCSPSSRQSCVHASLNHSRSSLRMDLCIRSTFCANCTSNLSSTLACLRRIGIRPT